ncbi:MAG: formylglycine-generating enzyme family protein, partial [Proteobacteria bacterium]|nr:formylglycine-generating enzyme family protein [Pseudomonadota bacterium]
ATRLPAWERCKLREWAVGVAEGVKRPDLAIRAHVELRGEDEQGRNEWDQWCKRALGRWMAYPVREHQAISQAGHAYIEQVTGTRMLWIPGGEFLMGLSELDPEQEEYDRWAQPVHRVRVSSFWLGEHVVTNREYGRFTADSAHAEPWHWHDEGYNEAEQPVVAVSWYDAVAYCEWLSKTSGRQYGLPSEAQWEYAARGPASRTYPWGEQEPDERRAHYESGAGPLPVASKPAGKGPFGTHDQAGNVWEWCRDRWNEHAYQGREHAVAEDPETTEGATDMRPLRGGSWCHDAEYLRSAFRFRDVAGDRSVSVGFRVAAFPPSRAGGS